MGDFNYAGIDWEHMIVDSGRDAQLFHENALDNLLVQHVNFITRHRVNNNRAYTANSTRVRGYI